MNKTQSESQSEVESAGTEQPAGIRPKGPFTAPRATPPAPATEQQGGETTASTSHDDILLDTECEVIAIGHAKFYLRYADWLPPLADDEFDGLTASIREHGIQQPVVVYRLLNNHFDVIDGLHRLKVAQALELDLAQIPLNILDQATSVKEQKALAWSLNADRRHLTKEQRQARALELRKEGLSYRAIAEELGVGRGTVERDIKEAGVPSGTPEGKAADVSGDMPKTVTGKDGKAYPAVTPAPTEGEIDIAREFIIDALRRKYSPLARGQLYRDASRIAGASGIKRKAFDAALDAMLEAGSVKEHINAHGAREYHFKDIVERLEQRAASESALAPVDDGPDAKSAATAPDDTDELARFLRASVPFIISAIRAGKHRTRAELDQLLDLERASARPRKSLVDFLTFYRVPDAPPAAPTIADELRARFDEDAVTLAGRTDDGARHRAIEIARKLVAAGIWNGSDWIEFDAYALHDRLFGVNRVEPSDLVEGDDYWFVTPPGQGDEPAAAKEAETDDAPDDAAPEFWQRPEAYSLFANAAQSMTFYIGQLRHAQSIPWSDVDEVYRQRARELLDELSAAAADLPDLLSEISQKLGAA